MFSRFNLQIQTLLAKITVSFIRFWALSALNKINSVFGSVISVIKIDKKIVTSVTSPAVWRFLCSFQPTFSHHKMASQISIGTIEKLVGRENYPSWKFAVKNYLEHEELWEEIEPKPGYISDEKKNTKARSKIILLIDPVNYVHVQDATSAKQVWVKLEKVFDDSGLSRKVGLLRDLVTTTLDNCSGVEDYINKVMTTAHKLHNINFVVGDEWLGTLLLAGLPDHYKPMIMALESSGVSITTDDCSKAMGLVFRRG